MKKPVLDRVLMAYRPLYLNGLLLDGQYKRSRPAPTDAAPRARRRALLAALTHLVWPARGKP
jgi:hypothetical protein